MEPLLRAVNNDDIPAIHLLETRTFPDPWPLEAFTDFVLGNAWVLDAGGELLAFILYHVVLDEAMILNFGVDPSVQRQGYGSRLLKESMQILIDRGVEYFYLDVRYSNVPAIRLYHSLGYQRLGVRKNYYQQPPEDALVMGLQVALMEAKRDS